MPLDLAIFAGAPRWEPVEKERGQDWAALIDRLAAKLEPAIRQAFAEACAALADAASVKALAEAIQQGDTAKVEALLGLGPQTKAFEPLMTPIQSAIQAGAEAAAANPAMALGPRAAKLVGTISFNLFNPRTVDHLNHYRMHLISRVTEETREGIREAVKAGVLAGQNPRETAIAVRQVAGFGLTKQHARAVHNYRAELERLDAAALSRALRDRRFDATIKAALKGKAPLTKAKIAQMVERYAARLLKHRAEMIARTESLRAANAGSYEAIRQATEEQGIPAEGIVRKWHVAKDERVCWSCRQTAKDNAKGVGLNQPFITPYGPVLYPPAHVMCRCTCTHRITEAAILAAGDA